MSNLEYYKKITNNGNFSNFKYENELLTYSEKSIDLKNISLEECCERALSSSNSLNEEKLFEIIEIMKVFINKNNIMSEDRFFELIKKPTIYNEKEKLELDSYYKYFFKLLKFEDYISLEAKDLIDRYIDKIVELELIDEDLLNFNQKKAISKYKEMFENIKEENSFTKNKKKRLKKVSNPKKNGFVNAAYFVILILLVGMTCFWLFTL